MPTASCGECTAANMLTNVIFRNLASRQAPNDSRPRMHTLAVEGVSAHAQGRIPPAAWKSEQLQPAE